MAFNLADMVAKRPKQIQEENSSDTVYRDVFKLIPSKANFYGFPSPIGELHFSIPSPQPHVLSGTDRGIAGEK